MSIQAAADFVARANEDDAIRSIARTRFSDIVNVGRDHGFDFTHDEFRLAMQERKAASATDGMKASTCECRASTVCECGATTVCECGATTVCECGG